MTCRDDAHGRIRLFTSRLELGSGWGMLGHGGGKQHRRPGAPGRRPPVSLLYCSSQQARKTDGQRVRKCQHAIFCNVQAFGKQPSSQGTVCTHSALRHMVLLWRRSPVAFATWQQQQFFEPCSAKSAAGILPSALPNVQTAATFVSAWRVDIFFFWRQRALLECGSSSPSLKQTKQQTAVKRRCRRERAAEKACGKRTSSATAVQSQSLTGAAQQLVGSRKESTLQPIQAKGWSPNPRLRPPF